MSSTWRAGALLFAAASVASAQPPSFVNFEAGHVRPLALSADGDQLYVVNTPDARLEIFDLTGELPANVGSVPVGLSPVAVAVAPSGEVWVVNHLSDSVSIVDVEASPPRVVRTLLVGDEPRDIVFAGPGGARAFVATAHRGQASPYPDGEYDTPGIGRADVWVFDSTSDAAEPMTRVTLFGDAPRALAASPDGSVVYASVFLSGNRTTTISEGAVCDGGSEVGPCSVEGTTYPGGLPAPDTNVDGEHGPETGLIVRQYEDDGAWEDELGRDWSAAVRFELPDRDVFAIDANAATPAETESYSGVGTALFAMVTHPTTGELFVANTEAHNEVRFEGLGEYVRELGLRVGQPASVRGHLHEARITRISGDSVTPVHLNPHLEYGERVTSADVRWRTLAMPTAIAFDAEGDTLYVAATGSSSIGVLATSDLDGDLDTSLERSISLRDPWPGGPTGIVVDDARERLYVTTRFDNAVVTIDLVDRSIASRTRMHSPEDEATVTGRPILYDALATSSNGEAACGSCHLYGDMDGLAWDLGDPDGAVAPNPNPTGPIGSAVPFHPLKGPMTTQSLRGMADHGPMHWRGDRSAGSVGGDPMDEVGAFMAFNGAFFGLLGREEGDVSDAEMRRFAEFAVRIAYPPNPVRQLDNSLRPDEQRGSDLFGHDNPSAPRFDGVATCDGCHRYDRSEGFFGSDGRTTFENEPQEMKVAHLRNIYAKVGMFGMPSVPFLGPSDFGDRGPQVRGFGYLHDGSIDTVMNFFRAGVFSLSESERRDMTAFMMAFDSVLPPVVGQQVTIAGTPSAEERSRLDLLIARAQAAMVWPGGSTTRECDLVAHGISGGEARGWVLRDGAFVPDRGDDLPIPIGSLDTALESVDVVTFTCVPPGSGERMAIDRDEDGTRDGDDDDPTDRMLFDIPVMDVTPPDGPPPGADAGPPPAEDAGAVGGDAGTTPDLDAGTSPSVDAGSSAGGDDGCGCSATGVRSPLWSALLLLFLFRRRK